VACNRWREAISARLDGELSAGEEEALREHLASCLGCRRFARDVEELHRAFRVRSAPAVPDLTEQILAGLPTARGPAAPRPRSARRRGRIVGAAAVALAVATVGAAWSLVGRDGADHPPALQAFDARVTAGQRGGLAALYLAVVNDGGADELVSATTAVADRAVLHDSQVRDGLVVMETCSAHRVPGDAAAVFRPDGAHVMLIDLRRDLRPGDTVPVELRFTRSDTVRVTATVVDEDVVRSAHEGAVTA